MSLDTIQQRIQQACHVANRTDDVQLIAVSKVQPNERVQAVLNQGHRVFGENKVQEAAGKWPDFKAEYDDIELHLLGPLQTNKVKQAVQLFDTFHALDRPKLAKRLASEIQAQGKSIDIFVQVNTGAEPQKAGILPQDADAFIAEARVLDLPVIGLMVIPPIDEDAGLHFERLKKIAERNGLGKLSMGMSADFEKAIAFGATHVRVGSAIFGERVKV